MEEKRKIIFYKGDNIVVEFEIGKNRTIRQDGFTLIRKKGLPILLKDGKRYHRWNRMEVK